MQLPVYTTSTKDRVAIGQKRIKCPRCHARVVSLEGAVYCDQCGHRLPELTEIEEGKSRRKRSKKKREDQPEDATTHMNEGPWFWEEPWSSNSTLLSADSSKTDGHVQERKMENASSLMDTNGEEVRPPDQRRPLLKKAVTSHPGQPVAGALRRVRSFGDTAPQQLPPLAVSTTSKPKLPPQTPKQSTPESHTSEETAQPTAGVLWGSVLSEAIDDFESKRIILAAEIDSDERCISVLAQQLRLEDVNRSKYVVARGKTQVQYKHDELVRKVRMNREKLSQVQERLRCLRSQQDDTGPRPEVSLTDTDRHSTTQNQQDHETPTTAQESTNSKQRRKSTHHTQRPSAEQLKAVAAVAIQRRFRVLRTRKLFAAMVKRAFERVFDPESKQYFYYNRHTKQSQWQQPVTLAKVSSQKQAGRLRRRRREPTAGELGVAAAKIQALYRRRAARKAMHALLAGIYEKVYDPQSDSYYYYCKHTKTSSWDKPKLLGREDLPAPLPVDHALSQAATKIQRLFRTRATRLFLHELIKGNIDKHFDTDAQAWYYFNRRTQQSFWEQARHAELSVAVRRS